MAFFACCREIYNPAKHVGFKKGERPEAVSTDPNAQADKEGEQAIIEKTANKTGEARGDTNIEDAFQR